MPAKPGIRLDRLPSRGFRCLTRREAQILMQLRVGGSLGEIPEFLAGKVILEWERLTLLHRAVAHFLDAWRSEQIEVQLAAPESVLRAGAALRRLFDALEGAGSTGQSKP